MSIVFVTSLSFPETTDPMLPLRRFRLDMPAALRAFARRRPAWMVSFSVEEASLSEGLRAACAATAMLIVGELAHDPLFAWAAIGAFWTCLADAAGTHRRRLASMGTFAVLSTLAGGATALASGVGNGLAALAIFMVAAFAGLTSIWAAPVYQVAILVATACVVMVDHPLRGLADGLPFLAVYASGCVFALLLSFTVWRIHPLAPARYATRLVYAQLAELARDIGRLLAAQTRDAGAWSQHAADTRSQTRAALEAAHSALLGVPLAKSEGQQAARVLAGALADAESLFIYLIAVSDVAARSALARAARTARALAALGDLLARSGQSFEAGDAIDMENVRQRAQRFAARIESAFELSVPLQFFAAGAPAPHAAAADKRWQQAMIDALRRAYRTWHDNASPASAGVRHAGRLALATTAAFLIVRLLGVPYGYWATMATLLVLQPSVGSTWPRSLERAAGSAAGAALAVVIGRFAHTPLTLALAVFPLVCLTMSLRRVSYGLFVLFLTPTFVLVADFALPSSELRYALARLGNNVLGALLALLATRLLWPMRDANRLHDAMLAAIRTNLAWLRSALPGCAPDWAAAEQLRRAAGVASNQAESVLRLARMETVGTNDVHRNRIEILALLRGMAGTASRLHAAQATPEAPAALVVWIDAAFCAVEQRLGGAQDQPVLAAPPAIDASAALADALSQLARLCRLLDANARARGR